MVILGPLYTVTYSQYAERIVLHMETLKLIPDDTYSDYLFSYKK